MQDFIDQAQKNNVTLLRKGKCQFCGANYEHGIFDCMENYNFCLSLLDFSNPDHLMARFLSVDAHALQHPEIHGRWSNHFHLARLNLILEKGVSWDYKKSPLLSNYLNAYKLTRTKEILTPPKPLERGKTTAKDLTKATSSSESIELIKDWANEVYQSWSASHQIVAVIANGILSKNGF